MKEIFFDPIVRLICSASLSPVFIPSLKKYLFLGVHQRVYVYNSEHLCKNLEMKYFITKQTVRQILLMHFCAENPISSKRMVNLKGRTRKILLETNKNG
jgi:hypothetical protein